MSKIVPLATRALGAEPGIPDRSALAEWIAGHRGTAADLQACRLDLSLAPELSAGITHPCAGGLFCRDRMCESLAGLNAAGDTVTGDLHADTALLAQDARLLAAQRKDVWCALPAPRSLGITDRYYRDDDEWSENLTTAYRTLMRAMRDEGIGGHVLICDTVEEQEISRLAGKKVFFFAPAPGQTDLIPLMEYQRQVAVGPLMLEAALDLANEYEVNRWIIVDPDEEGIRRVLSHVDPDQVVASGYCTAACDTYWSHLVDHAVYRK
jgi:hypothetical protein